MESEQRIAEHYAHGSLERTLLDAVRATGKDPARLQQADLAGADEFHIGGRKATADLAGEMGVRPGMRLLDIGCGIGGPSRHFAQDLGCRVSGIDLAPEFVAVAASLSERLGVGDRTDYRQGSAVDLPFPAAAFDGAYMIHVGMNIEDKARLFAEVHRVLRPGAVFGIYDLMRVGDGDFAYPVPWSARPDTNFIATLADYRRLLAEAGFRIEKERDRLAFAIDYFRQMRARAAENGPSPLGPQIVMGPTVREKIANLVALLERGVAAPAEIVCRAGAPPR